MGRGAKQVVWPKRQFTVPRSPLRTLFGVLASVGIAALVAGVLSLLLSMLFVHYPRYASVFGWRQVEGPRDALVLLLREPAGWIILVFAAFTFLLMLTSLLAPTGDITLMPDRIIIRDGSSMVEVPYWQIERIWVKKEEDGQDWLILEGAFSRTVRLPLEGEHKMRVPTMQALPHLLQRIPAWSRVSPDVTRRLAQSRE